MEKKNNVKATVAIDIRGFCAQCGIIITERNLEYPITGAGTDMDDGYHIILHKWLPEEQKRVTIASILAVCLVLKDRASCLMTECRDDDLHCRPPHAPACETLSGRVRKTGIPGQGPASLGVGCPIRCTSE